MERLGISCSLIVNIPLMLLRLHQVKVIMSLLLCVFSVQTFAQENESLKGIVLDVNTAAPLVGASIYWEGDVKTGVTSSLNGSFLIQVENLPARLMISSMGYQPVIRTIHSKDIGKELKFYMDPEEMSLDEIVIQERKADEQVRSLETGKATIPIAVIKNLPALFGEVDLLRSLQLLPGVQTAGEGTTGLFVRGGSADQNLMLLDGAPVYNASHFLGFFSVFNPDALESVDLYKGNMPAYFGGRLSSLIDVEMKEGNFDQLRGTGGIGSISSRLTVEGPLFSEKSSFIVSGRRTYADVALKLIGNEDIKNNQLYFYDLSGKLAFRLGERDKLTISSYQGSDFLGLEKEFGLGYANWVSAVNWSRNISKDTFFDLSGYYSRYKYGVNYEDPDNGFDWTSLITETGVKAQWSMAKSENFQPFWGIHSQYYNLSPIKLTPSEESAVQGINTNPKNAVLNNLFAGAIFNISPKVSSEIGLRMGFYNQVGKGVVYNYQDNESARDYVIENSVSYAAFQNIKFYHGLEPRVAIRYLINEGLSLKAAYNRNLQYLQIASNSSAGLPVDRWILADRYIPPIQSDQVSIGVFKNFQDNRWELSVEGYAKNFKNIIDIKNGESVLFTDHVETAVLAGKGYAYGGEFLLRKNVGNTTGWLSYTYARTWRKTAGISRDQRYNPRYDRPHDLTLVLNHEFSKSWSAGLTFIYTTGLAVSFPKGNYTMDNQFVPYYSEYRNQDRFPNYHRLDASVTWKKPQKGRKWRGSWNFSVYNLYGRKNPFTYEFRKVYNNDIKYNSGEDGPVVSAKPGIVMTYLFTFLPSLTYNFEF